MLGEILGRRAGLAWDELFRFLLRVAGRASPRLLGIVALGEAIAPNWGDGNTGLVADGGALARAAERICPLADKVGVASPSLLLLIWRGARVGLVDFAGSGRTMSSMICSISASANEVCSFKCER